MDKFLLEEKNLTNVLTNDRPAIIRKISPKFSGIHKISKLQK